MKKGERRTILNTQMRDGVWRTIVEGEATLVHRLDGWCPDQESERWLVRFDEDNYNVERVVFYDNDAHLNE